MNMCVPGYWTHTGVYVGNDKVVHSTLSEGVIEEDILQFLQCDGIAVLRAPIEIIHDVMIEVPQDAKSLVGKPYDFCFETFNDSAFYCTEVIKYIFRRYPEITIKPNEKSWNDSIPPSDLWLAGFTHILQIRR